MRLLLQSILLVPLASAFAPHPNASPLSKKYELSMKPGPHSVLKVGGPQESTRKAFLAGMAGAFSVLVTMPQAAQAIPMVTTDEFSIILRDSPLSIEMVEFTGTKSETVTVRLVDGTTFGLKDIVESATDPRSPLKVAAACRENGVSFKFLSLEAALSSATKKKTLYTNQRVQDAAEKEREKRERIRLDEEDRLAQLKRMEMQN